ncbi:hypothetical protein BV25DRAFT_1810764 [Artomyces pyxidatus]|uniref:Uncharacterized protein n=1 Tax=Artomyces pyxidatus TaxID=48021 RepID=A0ACB8SQA7_9AGAM|nr:hypothetical protein BV25DRAFT_1810764 [Artomyces pyxidatus]
MGWKAPTNKFSSLSTLSMALEKLKMPPPSRPATSVGFNDTAQRSSGEQETQDDSVVGRTTSKTGKSIRGPSPIKRATTVSSITSAKHTASGSKASVYVRPAHKAPVAGPSRINLGSGIVRGKPVRSATNIFGGPMRVTEKVSKKSSLPVVMGSPVKGGSLTEEAEEADMATMSNAAGNGEAAEENGEKRAAIPRVEPMDLSAAIRETDPVARGLMGPPGDSHQEVAPPDRWKANPSRRASMASQLLSQTLAELPQTPPRKAKASVEPVQSGSPRSPSERAKTLRSASGGHMTGSKSAPGALGKGNGVGAHVTASGSDSASGSGKKKLAHTLKVLKSCTVFVDVRSDDGDDAGGLFVDMLRGLGARILGSAGTTCTHIVYKNGLMSTLTKYRLMDEPKPFVVGIAWVVECAEQRAKADESKFLVDLELVNVAGTNKRRRSMLPKHIYSMPRTPPSRPWMSSAGAGTSSSAGDQSMDGNSSDLPPLERARKRRSLMLGR